MKKKPHYKEIYDVASNLIEGFFTGIVPFFFMMIFNLMAGFYFTQVGLQRNPASRFTPVNNTVNILTTILGGILIFHQIVGNIPFYTIGIIMGTLAIILLSKYNIEDDEMEEEEPREPSA